MFLEQHLSDSTWDYALPLSNHFEVELIVVVEEAAAVLRHCSDQLRCSWKRSARSGRVDQLLADQTYLPSPFSEACDDSLLRFEDALTALNQQLQSCGPHHRTPDSCDADTHDYYSRLDLQVASVRLLALKLSSKVMACVQSVEDIEGAGLLLTPSSFPPTLK